MATEKDPTHPQPMPSPAFEVYGWALSTMEHLITMNLEKDEKIYSQEEAARIDDKTGLQNELGAEEAFDAILDGSRVGRDIPKSHAMIMLDLDHFKLINDALGHDGGDEVIEDFGIAMRDGTRRASDVAARLHGEEFMVLLPNTTVEEAMLVVANIGGIFKKIRPDVTFSAGVAKIIEHKSFKANMKRADRALYAAKNRGRDMAVPYTKLSKAEKQAIPPTRYAD